MSSAFLVLETIEKFTEFSKQTKRCFLPLKGTVKETLKGV